MLLENPYLLKGYCQRRSISIVLKQIIVNPLKGNVKLEAGLKSSYVKTDNDAQYTYYNKAIDSWDIDQSRSNHFIYEEKY